jgi:hypothetical protein
MAFPLLLIVYMSSKDNEFQLLIEKIRLFCGDDDQKFDDLLWFTLAEYLRGEFKLIRACIEGRNFDLAKIIIISSLENYDCWVTRKRSKGPLRPWGG